jgi:hypothetical protein
MKLSNVWKIYEARPASWVAVFVTVLVVARDLLLGLLYRMIFRDRSDSDFVSFYSAARCWIAGRSPYVMDTFHRYTAMYGPPRPFFAGYLPTILPVLAPVAPFSFATAEVIFRCINFAAAIALFWCTVRMARHFRGGPLTNGDWCWLLGANSLAAVSAPIHFGQTSLLISLAVAATLVGLIEEWPWLAAAGILISSAKPILSFPLFLFALIFQRSARRPLVYAILASIPFAIFAAWVDPNLVHSYLASAHAYTSDPLNKPTLMIGLLALLEAIGVPATAAYAISAAAFLAVAGVTAAALLKQRAKLTESHAALALLLLMPGLATPVHNYDFSCYTPAIALMAAMPRWTALPAAIATLALIVPRLFMPPVKLDWYQLYIGRDIVYGSAWAIFLLLTLAVCVDELRKSERTASAAL